MSLVFSEAADALSRTTNLPPITTHTVMAWVKLTDVTTHLTDSQIICFGNSGAAVTNYMLGTTGNGLLYQTFSDAGGVASATHSFDATNWVHIAQTVAGVLSGNRLAYWNGVLDMTAPGDNSNVAQLLTLGVNGFGEWWNGLIAGVKIYSAVLSGTEIATEAANWLPQRVTNLNGWYPMTAATVATCLLDTDAPGYTNNGNHWTAGSTATTIGANPPLAPSLIWEQEGYQWRRDDGTEATATLIGGKNNPL